jgi:hypothetical protein
MNSRAEDLAQFYELLRKVRDHLGGTPYLRDLHGRFNWPQKGVYFFFQEDELRSGEFRESRVVRVGTHAVSIGSKSTLWNRLRAHKGTGNGLGNHRGSIFRLHVGASMIIQGGLQERYPHWGIGQYAAPVIRDCEADLERAVSEYIGRMRVLWVGIYDTPSSHSDRAYIEQNSIGLLAGQEGPTDTASPSWLGNHSPILAIRKSSLWNVNYVNGTYSPAFLNIFSRYVNMMLGLEELSYCSLAPANWSHGNDVQLKLMEDSNDE